MFSGHLLAMVLGALVGVSLGALGGGGSIITTPVLVYVAHVPPEKAVGMSLFIVGTTSLAGALLHMRRGNVVVGTGLLFSLTGVVGSFLGSTGTHLVPRRLLMLLFSCLMAFAACIMWRGAAAFGRSKSCSVYQCLLAGFGVGLLTGFLGVGGGFLIVPALVLFAGLDSRMAAGTALVVIAFNSITGLVGQLRFIRMDWSLLFGFLLFAIGGIVVGSTLSTRLSDLRLRRIFAVTVFILAIVVGLDNLLPEG
jgi:uncharacterized membrane protein YfcA